MNSVIIIAYISALSPIIPLGIASLKPSILKSEQWLLISLLLLSLLTDYILWFLSDTGANTWPIANIFFVFQFSLLFLMLAEYRNRGQLIILVLFILSALINFSILQTPLVFNSRTSYIGALLIIGMALRYLYLLFREMPIANILNMPMLWVSFGVLFYFAGTLFLFLFNNYLILNQPQNHQLIWVLHNVLNIIKNLLFAVALWKYYRQSMLWK